MNEIINEINQDLINMKNSNISIEKIYHLQNKIMTLKKNYENQIEDMISKMENMRKKHQREIENIQFHHNSEINDMINKCNEILFMDKKNRIQII
jgi:predicted lactoylglutathione lyase